MRLYIVILFLAITLASAKVASNEAAKTDKLSQDVTKSTVNKKNEADEKVKVDNETKEQLEESSNDDEELERQQDESSGEQPEDEKNENNANNDNEQVEDENAEAINEESTNEKEDENANKPDSDNDSAKRTEEMKESGGRPGNRIYGYPLFYHGADYGAQSLGGPAQFHPAGMWQYPYPYVHPMYTAPFYPCQCNCNDEDKDESKEKDKGKKTRRKQLVPSHYYGPPSAGWGAYQPGHTGAGWGAPYWYKSNIPVSTASANRRFGIEGGNQYARQIGDYAQNLVAEGGRHIYDYDNTGHGYEAYNVGIQNEYGRTYGSHGSFGDSAGLDYTDLDNIGLYPDWQHGVGHAYVPYNLGLGYGHHHSFGLHHGHLPMAVGDHGLPTAQGHIQIANSGHGIGMGGHNLGGMADKQEPGHGTNGDFVAGIHFDVGHHGIHGHHGHHGHGHVAYIPGNAGIHGGHGTLHGSYAEVHGGHDIDAGLGLHEAIGDHFGSFGSHGHHGGGYGYGFAGHMGMQDHFGPIMEQFGHVGSERDTHGTFGHYLGMPNNAHSHGTFELGHGVSHRIFHDFGAHPGHGGAFDGHIGSSVYGHHFGGTHKSVVHNKQKQAKAIKQLRKNNKNTKTATQKSTKMKENGNNTKQQ